MITFTVNGKEKNLDGPMSISQYIEFLGIVAGTIVIEYNHDILKMDKWDGIIIKKNDNLEIVKFCGGG